VRLGALALVGSAVGGKILGRKPCLLTVLAGNVQGRAGDKSRGENEFVEEFVESPGLDGSPYVNGWDCIGRQSWSRAGLG
jgi:hypothetical protein